MKKLCFIVFAGISVCHARTFYQWNPSGSGGWQSAEQYCLFESGENATAAPTDGDVVVIPEGVTVEVATDADAAFVNKLDGVQLAAESSTFVFNQPSDIQWGCPVFGDGAMIKRTEALVEFLPNRQTDLYSTKFAGYSAYCTWGGFTVEKGTVKMPQGDTAAYSMGPVVLSNDTVFVLSDKAATQVAALNGYGKVISSDTAQASLVFQVGYGSWDSPRWNVSRFYGVLEGEGMKWSCPGTAYLYNENSTFSGTVIQWGRYDEVHPWGKLCVPKIGMAGQPSSIGTYGTIEFRTGGSFLYLGEGETTDKLVYWRTQVEPQTIIDAGQHGGITFTGNWSQYGGPTEESDNRMGRLLLTGDNTSACVVSGRIATRMSLNGTNYTTYITKSGTGTWRFENPENEHKGALAVTDGTFQFTSIAERNQKCALGTSELLYEDIFGARDESRKADYAFLLGGEGKYPTFEYTGGEIASCSTRPLALTGGGGRLSSSGAGSQLQFSGVYSFDSGEKKLTLGGDSCGHNVISGISSGSGSVAVCKEGSGRWIVRGENTIGGTLDVRGGRLELWDDYAPTYYRLVIKSLLYQDTSSPYTFEFAMYDAGGSNRVAGLTYLPPPVLEGEYGYPAAISDLAEGQALYYSASGCMIYNKTGYELDKLFDGTTTKFWRMYAKTMLSSDDPSKYIYVVMRLPADTPPLVAYDMVVGVVTPGNAIGKFSIECSSDGENWIPITDDVTVEAQSNSWMSGDAFEKGHPLRQGKGFALADAFSIGSEDSESVLDGVDTVRVAPGATLAALGKRKTVSSITVDCASGVGSLAGIDLVPGGVVKLVNLPDGIDDLNLPADFSCLTEESLRNLNAYNVEVPGSRRKMVVRADASSIRISASGFTVIVR